jgi:hypothetical protein
MLITFNTQIGLFEARGSATLPELYLALDQLTTFVEEAETEVTFEQKFQNIIELYNKSK